MKTVRMICETGRYEIVIDGYLIGGLTNVGNTRPEWELGLSNMFLTSAPDRLKSVRDKLIPINEILFDSPEEVKLEIEAAIAS